jgi:hypothetical protein
MSNLLKQLTVQWATLAELYKAFLTRTQCYQHLQSKFTVYGLGRKFSRKVTRKLLRENPQINSYKFMIVNV